MVSTAATTTQQPNTTVSTAATTTQQPNTTVSTEATTTQQPNTTAATSTQRPRITSGQCTGYRCFISQECISYVKYCNEVPDCADGTDELSQLCRRSDEPLGVCQSITPSAEFICTHLLPYENTSLPNYLNQTTQTASLQTAFALNRASGCHPSFSFLMCTTLFPKCEDDQQTPPCRELCEEVQASCEASLQAIGEEWPRSCADLPSRNDEECLEPTPGVCEPFPQALQSTCEPLTGYNSTSFPNAFGHLSFQEMITSREYFLFGSVLGNISTSCYPNVYTAFCRMFLPQCENDMQIQVCRSVCEEINASCTPVGLGLPFSCDVFPDQENDPTCSLVGQPPAGCEPIRYSRCMGLSYSQTSFPNIFQWPTQEFALQNAPFVFPTFDPISDCHPDLDFFLCSLFFPQCTPEGQISLCRSLCYEINATCGERALVAGIQWDASICPRLPDNNCTLPNASRTTTSADTTTIGPATPTPPSRTTEGVCQSITPSAEFICTHLLPYENTSLPNYLNQTTQTASLQAAFALNRASGCHPSFSFLMCTTLFPKCEDDQQTPPCRELCDEVQASCEAPLQAIGEEWPRSCTDLPSRNDEECLEPTPGACEPFPQALQSTCEPLTGYNSTSFPNAFGHLSFQEMITSREYFLFGSVLGNISTSCYPNVYTAFCRMFLPQCENDMQIQLCRHVCEEINASCTPVGLGLPFSCDVFPDQDDDPNCSLIAQPPTGCEPIRYSRCMGLPYSQTSFPNIFQWPTQDFALQTAPSAFAMFDPITPPDCVPIPYDRCQNLSYSETSFPNWQGWQGPEDAIGNATSIFEALDQISDCHKDLELFLCSLYFPSCTANGLKFPCRSFCDEINSACAVHALTAGIPWNIAGCTTLPASSYEEGCIVPEGLLDCVPVPYDRCQNMSYSATSFPNWQGWQGPEDAIGNATSIFEALDQISDCHKDLELFLCSLYFPSCTLGSGVKFPCRSFCDEINDACAVAALSAGIQWDTSGCTTLPASSYEEDCIAPEETCDGWPYECSGSPGSCVGAWQFCDGDRFCPFNDDESICSSYTCMPIELEFCQDEVPYNRTTFPNYLGQQNITMVEESDIHANVSLLADTACHEYVKFLYCHMAVPECVRDGVRGQPLCRTLCEEVRQTCSREITEIGFDFTKSTCDSIFPDSVQKDTCKLITEFDCSFDVDTCGWTIGNNSQVDMLQPRNDSNLGMYLSLDGYSTKPTSPTMYTDNKCLKLGYLVRGVGSRLTVYVSGPEDYMYFTWRQSSDDDEDEKGWSTVSLNINKGWSWFKVALAADVADDGEVGVDDVTLSDGLCEGQVSPGCEKIELQRCLSMPYNVTTYPNLLGWGKSLAMSLAPGTFQAFDQIADCHRDLHFYLCSLIFPECTPTGTRLPCRSFCENVTDACAARANVLSLGWDPNGCVSFPEADDPPGCVAPKGGCEPIRYSRCMGLSYTQTSFPNLVQWSSQPFALGVAPTVFPSYDNISDCHPDLNFFLCSILFPQCTSEGQILPCRSFCYEINDTCGERALALGLDWQDSICPTLPEEDCLLPDATGSTTPGTTVETTAVPTTATAADTTVAVTAANATEEATAAPDTEAATAANATEQVTAANATQAATAAPETEAATAANATQAATAAPETEAATAANATQAATATPDTEAATAANTTQEATAAPETEAATAANATQAATAAPETEAATAANATQEATATPDTEAATAANATQEATATPDTEAATAPNATEQATTANATEEATAASATEEATTAFATEEATTLQGSTAPPTTVSAALNRENRQDFVSDLVQLLKDDLRVVRKVLRSELSLTRQWLRAYLNHSSQEFKELRAEIKENALQAFSNVIDDLLGVSVKSLRQGSVVAELIIATSSNNLNDLAVTLTDAVSSGSFGNLTVDNTSLTVEQFDFLLEGFFYLYDTPWNDAYANVSTTEYEELHNSVHLNVLEEALHLEDASVALVKNFTEENGYVLADLLIFMPNRSVAIEKYNALIAANMTGRFGNLNGTLFHLDDPRLYQLEPCFASRFQFSYGYNGICYVFVNESLGPYTNFEDFNNACSRLGGIPVYITDNVTHDFLVFVIQTDKSLTGSDFGVGVQWNAGTALWEYWDNSDVLIEELWVDSYDPSTNPAIMDHCVAMSPTGTPTYGWDPAPCESFDGYICQLAIPSTTPPPTTPATPQFDIEPCLTDSFDNGYAYNDVCYVFFNESVGDGRDINFEDFEIACDDVGAVPVYVSNRTTHEFLAFIIRNSKNSSLSGTAFGVGIGYDPPVQAWEYSDGSEVLIDQLWVDTYNPASRPTDLRFCAAMDPSGTPLYGWNPEVCADLQGYICQKPIPPPVIDCMAGSFVVMENSDDILMDQAAYATAANNITSQLMDLIGDIEGFTDLEVAMLLDEDEEGDSSEIN
ncbi:uncharacterized protein [Branchiostoma lanceolatum]|uniref:uncharacterized protein n=1 Tax=Branchiostoma lanceolatum TaxID=7740 RepID=UPI003451F141